MRFKTLAATALSFSILFPVHNVQAAGFYIQEQSVRGLGTAFAGSVTSLDDASTVYFNPAGMTKLEGIQVNMGTHLIVPTADLDDNGSTFLGAAITAGLDANPYEPTPIPNFFAVVPVVDDRIWAGVGVNAPFGLANDYNESWFGRFDSTKTELTTINIQPSLAYKATEWLSIGGGLDIQYADAELQAAISNVASEGRSILEGQDWSTGFNVGLQIQPAEHTEIGIHYRSSVKHELEGRIIVEGLTAGNFNIGGTAALDLPDIATFGVAHQATEKLRLMGQATWFGWNNFQEILAISDAGAEISNVEQNYQTTWAFAIGAEYDLCEDWTVRAGYQYDETPTTDLFRTTRTPDGDRNWVTTGATYHLNPAVDIDFAAAYIHVGEENINVTRNSGLAVTRAESSGDIGIFSIGLNYKF